MFLDMLRLDQLDPVISGNKWYKLKHNLIAAQQSGKSTILSFGGAWSNHIHALAAAKEMPKTQIKGVAVLKGGDFLRRDIHQHIHHYNGQVLANWTLLTDYHHGGYARTIKELLSFIKSFEHETTIPLDKKTTTVQ